MSKIILDRLQYRTLKDDEWFDEVVLNVNYDAYLRHTIRPRYKTSSLSGNEWRTSTVWEVMKGGQWVFIQEFNNPSMATGSAAFYAEYYNAFPDLLELPCTEMNMLRKNHMLLSLNYGAGVNIPLIHALGHLPYIWETAFQRQEGIYGWEKEYGTPWWSTCFQPGCSSEASVTYRLRNLYCEFGEAHPNKDGFHRRFCRRHAIRGDSNLEDCDLNYVLVDGERRGAGPSEEDMAPVKLRMEVK